MSEDNNVRDRTRRTDEFPERNLESSLSLGARIGDRAELSSPDPVAAAAGDPFNIGLEGDDDDDRVDLNACECGWPELTVERAEVGPAVVQVLYCERCDYRFATVSGGAAGDE